MTKVLVVLLFSLNIQAQTTEVLPVPVADNPATSEQNTSYVLGRGIKNSDGSAIRLVCVQVENSKCIRSQFQILQSAKSESENRDFMGNQTIAIDASTLAGPIFEIGAPQKFDQFLKGALSKANSVSKVKKILIDRSVQFWQNRPAAFSNSAYSKLQNAILNYRVPIIPSVPAKTDPVYVNSDNAATSPCAGIYKIVANGYVGVLSITTKLKHAQDSIVGTVKFEKASATEKIFGTCVKSKTGLYEIEFTRPEIKQMYSATLMNLDDQVQLVGTFVSSGTKYNWVATRGPSDVQYAVVADCLGSFNGAANGYEFVLKLKKTDDAPEDFAVHGTIAFGSTTEAILGNCEYWADGTAVVQFKQTSSNQDYVLYVRGAVAHQKETDLIGGHFFASGNMYGLSGARIGDRTK